LRKLRRKSNMAGRVILLEGARRLRSRGEAPRYPFDLGDAETTWGFTIAPLKSAVKARPRTLSVKDESERNTFDVFRETTTFSASGFTSGGAFVIKNGPGAPGVHKGARKGRPK
jgi:hypothetical protein